MREKMNMKEVFNKLFDSMDGPYHNELKMKVIEGEPVGILPTGNLDTNKIVNITDNLGIRAIKDEDGDIKIVSVDLIENKSIDVLTFSYTKNSITAYDREGNDFNVPMSKLNELREEKTVILQQNLNPFENKNKRRFIGESDLQLNKPIDISLKIFKGEIKHPESKEE